MNEFALICPECRQPMTERDGTLVCSGGHGFPIRGRVHCVLPRVLSETLVGDAVYHASLKEQWIELAQMNTRRNLVYHRQVAEFIARLATAESNILELGGGAGFDLELFLNTGPTFGRYIFSEISEEQVAYVSTRVSDPRVRFFTIDASRLPFADGQFDFIYMVGALHHLPDPEAAVAEMARAARPGAFLIYAIEPNRRLFVLLKQVVARARRLMPRKAHSPADEEAEGFLIGDLEGIAARQRLTLVRLEPVWLFSGVAHYGLEFIFRALRLQKRIRLPGRLESLIIALDRLLLSLPGMRHLSWHYTVIYRKPSGEPAPRGDGAPAGRHALGAAAGGRP
jgi:SAM-dependent methyltransferase